MPGLLPLLPRRGAPFVLPSADAARRKTRSERARVPRAAFDAHLAGAATVALAPAGARLVAPQNVCLPAPDARPLCALSEVAGDDLGLGVLLDPDPRALLVETAVPFR